MRKGLMVLLGFFGIVLLAGGIALIVGVREWIGLVVVKQTIDGLKTVGSFIVIAGLSIFWTAVYYYARGQMITRLPFRNVIYHVICIGRRKRDGWKHLVITPVDRDSFACGMYYLCLKPSRVAKGIKAGSRIVRIGERLELVTNGKLPFELPVASKKRKTKTKKGKK